MSATRRVVLAPTPAELETPPQKATPAPSASDLDAMGRYQITYYWIADEKRYPAAAEVALRDRKCRIITRVSRRFRKALRMEGTGRLRDGRLINVAGNCRCGPCFVIVDDQDAPHGLGVKNRSLKPFRSVAAPRHIPIGTRLYVRELDGLTVPGAAQAHNGCVVADDRGGNVNGRQLDLFTGLKPAYRSFMRRHRLSRITVFDGGDHCADLDRPASINRGQG